jgi:hypothetical protein
MISRLEKDLRKAHAREEDKQTLHLKQEVRHRVEMTHALREVENLRRVVITLEEQLQQWRQKSFSQDACEQNEQDSPQEEQRDSTKHKAPDVFLDPALGSPELGPSTSAQTLKTFLLQSGCRREEIIGGWEFLGWR